jgi:hypothetical protein
VKAHKDSCRAVRFVDSGKGNDLLPSLKARCIFMDNYDLSYVLQFNQCVSLAPCCWYYLFLSCYIF